MRKLIRAIRLYFAALEIMAGLMGLFVLAVILIALHVFIIYTLWYFLPA